jgi:hypothetical protein
MVSPIVECLMCACPVSCCVVWRYPSYSLFTAHFHVLGTLVWTLCDFFFGLECFLFYLYMILFVQTEPAAAPKPKTFTFRPGASSFTPSWMTSQPAAAAPAAAVEAKKEAAPAPVGTAMHPAPGTRQALGSSCATVLGISPLPFPDHHIPLSLCIQGSYLLCCPPPQLMRQLMLLPTTLRRLWCQTSRLTLRPRRRLPLSRHRNQRL